MATNYSVKKTNKIRTANAVREVEEKRLRNIKLQLENIENSKKEGKKV